MRKMAFSTINFETLRSLTEGSEENRSTCFEEGSREHRSLQSSEEPNRCLTDLSEGTEETANNMTKGPEKNRGDVPASKKIEYKVIQLLPIPKEDWRRAAVRDLWQSTGGKGAFINYDLGGSAN